MWCDFKMMRTGSHGRRAASAIAAVLAFSFLLGAVALDAAQTQAVKRRNPPAKAADGAKAQATKKPTETLAAAKAEQSAKSFAIDFKEFKLKNGLRVLLAEDDRAPTFSICMTYNVGSRDERPGRTGFAHLFEHMLFQGSENVGKGEHFILIQQNGGSANGTTNAERTNYFETLPANQLELAIFLEADRMRAPAITQANFDNQRATVQEERRQNYDNRAYGKSYEATIDLVYDTFPYKHSTIGSMEDLNAATIQDAEAFFQTYYAPNNAVLSLVGNFQSEAALALIKKYFENIPAQTPPPVPDVREPEQKGERRKVLEDNFAQTPRLDVVFKIPPGNTPDWYALEVLGNVLSNGVSSRLYQKFVKEKELAVSVSADASEQRGPALFWFSVMARPTTDLAELEKLLLEEIRRAQEIPVSDAELSKVRMQLRRQRAQQLYSTRSRANSLGHFAVYYNDAGLINSVWDQYDRITKADLQNVARRYFTEANRSVVTTMPKAAAATGTR